MWDFVFMCIFFIKVCGMEGWEERERSNVFFVFKKFSVFLFDVLLRWLGICLFESWLECVGVFWDVSFEVDFDKSCVKKCVGFLLFRCYNVVVCGLYR